MSTDLKSSAKLPLDSATMSAAPSGGWRTSGNNLNRMPPAGAPERMKVLLADAGLACLDVEGIAWSPTRGLHLSDDVRLNYLVAAVRA